MAWSGAQSLFLFILIKISDGQYQDGDVRLVGGSYQWEGRVEVYMSGVWGTITDSDWTNDDAAVFCRKLGHFRPGATAHSNAYFGDGKGPVSLDSVICSGSEYILTDCELQNSGLTTSHSLDVGVKCQPAYGSYREGDIRLVGGPHNWEGRVEIFWNGEWGTISDSSWTSNDARVVCRQLEHAQGSGEAVSCCGEYGKGSDYIHIQNVQCNGLESNITQCPYTNVTSYIPHDQDIGVRCQQGNPQKEGEIRLTDFRESISSVIARVEIFISGEWGSIRHGQTGFSTAQVTCRQLGYNTYSPSYTSFLRQESTIIHYNYLYCTGSEYRLIDCQNRTYFSLSQNDWGVVCSKDGPEELDTRLSGTYSGLVQVFQSAWRYIADSNNIWTTNSNNSAVICRQLGYKTIDVTTSRQTTFGTYRTIDNVNCSGTESKLTDCSHDYLTSNNRLTIRVTCSFYSCTTGDIRLVGGGSEREGRVEVCSSNRWGTVCGKYWTLRHTAVVCRHLGFSDRPISYYSSERYGEGTGPVIADFVNCSGTEWNIWQSCTHYTHYFGCSHSDDVGVKCKPADCIDGQVRLAGIITENAGRVEICSNQRWGTFSQTNWQTMNAKVTCIELGFETYSNWRTSYGNGGGPRNKYYYRCTGSETRLLQCKSFNETVSRYQSSDVSVYCLEAYCSNGELRLMEGQNKWEGRVEVCYNGRWGTVGGDGWTETNSHVVCNSLGYDISDEPANKSIPNAPSKPLYYHSIRCSRRDLSLLECGFKHYMDATKTYPHAVVRCNKTICEDGELRLSGGSTEREGRLEICINKRWGTIDGDGWTHADTEVACEKLGYPSSDVTYTKEERLRYGGSQSLPVHMTLVGCYGSENNLTECSYHEFKSTLNVLSTSKDVIITCGTAGEPDSTLGQLRAVANTSLSISVVLAVVVIVLVAILILVVVFQRKKKRAKRTITSDLDGTKDSRYTSGVQSNNHTIPLDKLMAEDLPQDSYEEMEISNPLPVPPKANKPSTSKRCEAGNVNTKPSNGAGRANRLARPAIPVQQRHQQTWQPRPPSPEDIYECPN